MAEMPEENGLGPDTKLEDEDDEIVPKVNGHHDDTPVKQVKFVQCLMFMF